MPNVPRSTPQGRPAARHPGPAERADLDDADQLAELLVRAARRIHRSAVEELRPIGLTHAQGRALRVVARAGRPLRMADVAAGLEVVPRSATAMVDALVAVGLVERAVDPRDRRSILVGLTGEGILLLDRLSSARRRTAEAVFRPLSPVDCRDLARLLGTVCACDTRRDVTAER